MTLLAIDPSSTRCGYAIGSGENSLIDAGYISPPTKVKPPEDKALCMAEDLVELAEQDVENIIIETPAASTRGPHQKGQANYGMAVGIIIGILSARWPEKIETARADRWTRKQKKKHRQRMVAAQFPQYDADRDSGMDVSDAIALMQWWFREQIKEDGYVDRKGAGGITA